MVSCTSNFILSDISFCLNVSLPCLPDRSYQSTREIFFIIPVYLQYVQVHSVNWLKEVDECLGEGRSLALFYS
jgi:hypothetical protein